MPVLKIPIVHKFGIISHSQRLELQERLLRQTYQKENEQAAQAARHIRANPLEVCEKFVQRYNAAGLEERESLKEEAERIIVLSKRRAGVTAQGEGTHVDLPMAWSELAILAQCKGKLQEDCFEILCKSLNHAPLSEENIPTLFFLAESTLYWLRTDSVKQPYLRTAEIRLLKMGYFVFARLYYHHLVNSLTGLGEFKTRLMTYLEGIQDHQALYKSYPGVWLALRFTATIGEIIVCPYSEQKQKQGDDSSQAPPVIEPPVHLSALIYQALQVWRCSGDRKVGLKKAILDILISSSKISKENWIDSIFTISILGEAAKKNINACRSFQDIARGVALPPDLIAMMDIKDEKDPPDSSPVKLTTTNEAQRPKDERKKSTAQTETFQQIMNGMMTDFDSALGKTPYAPNESRGGKTNVDERSSSRKEKARTSKSPYQNFELPGTAHRTPRGTTTRSSAFSSIKTSRSDTKFDPDGTLSGISTWKWETAYQYTQVLADVCLNGATSSIQKTAILGKWIDADVTTFRAGIPNYCVESCGLVDLLEFRLLDRRSAENLHSAPNPPKSQAGDWSWRVRYGALSSLLHLTHALHGDQLRNGMRSAAWSLIVSLQDSADTDDRVLEALRVGQVEYPDFTKAHKDSSTPISIWSRITHGLTEHFLVPALPIPQSPSSLTQPASHSPRGETGKVSMRQTPKKPSDSQIRQKSQGSPRKISPSKPTLKDDLLLHTTLVQPTSDYHMRNNLNLQRIVEDQWRKDLLKEHEIEEKNRLEEIKAKHREEEARMQEVAERRREKLKGRPTEKLAPYEVA